MWCHTFHESSKLGSTNLLSYSTSGCISLNLARLHLWTELAIYKRNRFEKGVFTCSNCVPLWSHYAKKLWQSVSAHWQQDVCERTGWQLWLGGYFSFVLFSVGKVGLMTTYYTLNGCTIYFQWLYPIILNLVLDCVSCVKLSIKFFTPFDCCNIALMLSVKQLFPFYGHGKMQLYFFVLLQPLFYNNYKYILIQLNALFKVL